MPEVFGFDVYQNVAHDSYIAFGDAAVPPAKHFDALRRLSVDNRVIDGTASGVPVIACFTEADDPLPIEILKSEGPRATSVRVCWTTDVDDLDGGEGAWRTVGRLNLASGSCLIWDPFRYEAEAGCVIDVVKGIYLFEVFYTESDCLGARITLLPKDPS